MFHLIHSHYSVVNFDLKKHLNLSTKSVNKGGVGSQGALKELTVRLTGLCPATLSLDRKWHPPLASSS